VITENLEKLKTKNIISALYRPIVFQKTFLLDYLTYDKLVKT